MMNIEQYDGAPDWMRSEHMTGVCLFIWFFYMMFFCLKVDHLEIYPVIAHFESRQVASTSA